MDDVVELRAESLKAEEEEEDAESIAQENDEEEVASERSPSPAIVQQFPRKKRLGRPPKNRPPDWNQDPENVSEGGTPIKRKRGRPAGGGRGRPPKGGPSHTTRVPIDKEGNMMDVINDEVNLPEDEEGEKKVDRMGNLQGGRDYRVRIFTIKGRGDRQYMLSTEPARCCGFRDSYLFFTKHMQLYKIIIDDVEKRDLIDREIIPHSYKGRAIGVVTARSVFREFGARIIIGGKRVIDDYYVTAARERGDVEGELADPNDRLPAPGEPYNKNQYVAWHGASSVYHTGVPSVPTASGKPVPGKRKVNITSANWQFEHGRAASRFNTSLSALRRANLANGVYDPHTNLMCYPKTTQPTHARWERVSAAETDVPPIVARKYLIVDKIFQQPPFAGLGIPGPDADYVDVGTNGLPNLADEDLAEMKPEESEVFEQMKNEEREWRSQWSGETTDGARSKPRIGFVGVPV
ncbi:nuclear localization protein [Macroventuria anomochaeta]|uniref:Nuclear localization protein n=1 Tax=Macroventuria anomochaeta TaxID=301207 RepID=A0ACB6SGP9_9PLEO|nr:nuclear localization protein [Macroventuria anomochaeta]KAF2632439.1 nuclear localization protein [Macroventuria anomochaeta]